MTKGVDRKFLRDVQDEGWHVEQVGTEEVIARCPREGCGMRAKLSSAAPVPSIDHDWTGRGYFDQVSFYAEWQNVLRGRREELGLTLHELEDVLGVATDYLAKAEKPSPAKIPNLQTALDWASALGLRVVIVPGPIQEASALQAVVDTRPKLKRRRGRVRIDRARRGEDARPDWRTDGRY